MKSNVKSEALKDRMEKKNRKDGGENMHKKSTKDEDNEKTEGRHAKKIGGLCIHCGK